MLLINSLISLSHDDDDDDDDDNHILPTRSYFFCAQAFLSYENIYLKVVNYPSTKKKKLLNVFYSNMKTNRFKESFIIDTRRMVSDSRTSPLDLNDFADFYTIKSES
jgi:hypothetical protein